MEKKQKTIINKNAVGVGVASLAAAAIGAYWLYGAKNAAKHRKTASSWMLKVRADVMDAVERLKDIDKDTYLNIVDNVVSKYNKTRNSAEVLAIAKEMKSAWSQISSNIKPAKKAVKKVVKKVTN